MKLLFEASRELPLVQLVATFRAGGVSDPVGLEGLSRITARMLRRGSRTMTGEQLEGRVDSLGADLAASVGLGSTTVGVEVVSRSLEKAVALAAEVIAEPAFDEDELEKLKRQVEAEIVASRDEDEGLAARALRRRLFAGHPHGRRVQGTIASVRAITREDVIAHHRRAFSQENAIVAIGGDVSGEQATDFAVQLTERLPKGERLPYAVGAPVPPVGRRLVIVDKPERTQTQIIIGARGVHPREPSFWPLVLGTTVFGGTFTSRLMREVRSKRGWSYGASARVGYDRQPDALTVWTFPAAKDAAACIALELALLDTWRDKGVTARELAFVRRYLVRSHAFEIDTAHKRVGLPLEVALLDLPPTHHSAFVEHVRGVTLESVQAAVAAHAPHRDLLIAVVGTHADIGSAVRDAIPNLADASVVPFDSE